MNSQEQYPSLSYFLTCYFHQDFKVLFDTADKTISAYQATEAAEEQLKMKDEIKSLLNTALPEKELQDLLLNKMDCNYYFLNDWDSSDLWLRHIYKQLS